MERQVERADDGFGNLVRIAHFVFVERAHYLADGPHMPPDQIYVGQRIGGHRHRGEQQQMPPLPRREFEAQRNQQERDGDRSQRANNIRPHQIHAESGRVGRDAVRRRLFEVCHEASLSRQSATQPRSTDAGKISSV